MENIKNEIISNSRHQIIYYSNFEERKQLLEGISKENPLTIGNNKPAAIYVDDLAPNVDSINDQCDTRKLSILSKDYLEYSIAYEITKELSKITHDEKIIDNILGTINSLYLNNPQKHIKTLDELIKGFEKTKDYYSEKFIELTQNGDVKFNFCKIPFCFFELERYVRKIKTFLNNDSYMVILLNHQQDIFLESTKAINNLIASRINKDISIKLATKKEDWKTYVAQNGELINPVHDYDIIYLDDEHKSGSKTIKY